PAQMTSPLIHENSSLTEIASHAVTVDWELLQRTAGCSSFMVNSYHHQGVKDLAPGLRAAAHSQDGMVEAAFMPDQKFILAVQWHPELNFKGDSISLDLFRLFVDSAKI
ncbi:MAG: gamma-glutamyl-gamma-aminobutyrate hydrolase family protein, partial [Eubacteriales bacterium]